MFMLIVECWQCLFFCSLDIAPASAFRHVVVLRSASFCGIMFDCGCTFHPPFRVYLEISENTVGLLLLGL